ncbi:MAG: hypothetical protein IJ244_00785 [Bacteroidaceae bacterium]|nr:hypothetical protein [Bacteroidaceae bacterium]
MVRNIILVALTASLPLLAHGQKAKEFTYSGTKINLSESTFKCKHLGKLQGQPKEGYQGMDIWGDYVVSCQNTGYMTLYQTDGDKLTRLGEPFKMASFNKNNHCNVVSFSRTFYDKDDRFPLLYVSQCQRGTINGRKDVIYVERIGNDLKHTELIQTIYFRDVKHLFGYALQWVIDVDNNYLYGYGNTVDNSNPLNKHRIVKFRLPDLSEATDGLITLTNEDLLENYLLEETYAAPFMPIGQGLFIKNGQLFMPTGVGTEKYPSILYVWNLRDRVMQNVIDLSQATFGELEDCAYYKGDLMIQAQGDFFKLSF